MIITDRHILLAERLAAAWYACYQANGDPLDRFYGHEDLPGWRDGFDCAIHDDPTRIPASIFGWAGWLCGRMVQSS